MHTFSGFIFYTFLLVFSITINSQAQEQNQEQEKLFIESLYSPEMPYVQQAVRYTLRFWRDSHLQQGYFLTPDIPDAILLEDKENEIRQVKKEGQEYEVLEQHYILIPQKSGEIQLPEPVFSSRELFVKGKPLSLNVKPRPHSFFQKNWLIAKAIYIEQKWMIPERPLQAGEPVERTIIINGIGIMGAQLPKVQATDSDSLKFEKGSLSSTEGALTVQKFFDNSHHSVSNGELYGQRTQKLRYIPTASGNYSIPEISFLWWNSESGEIEKELIPGRLISVEQGVIHNEHKSLRKVEKNNHKTPFYYAILSKLKNIERKTIYTTLLFSAIILLFFLLQKKSMQLKNAFNHIRNLFQTMLLSRGLNAYQNYKLQLRLKKACQQSDYVQIKTILLEWAKIQYPEHLFLNLVALSAMSQSETIIDSLAQIDRYLYGNSAIKKVDSKTKSSLVNFIRTSSKPKISNNKLLQLPQMWQHQSGS